jgi:phenylacetate-CoA ligase
VALWADLVEDARRAPSPHNTQPWLVEAEDRTAARGAAREREGRGLAAAADRLQRRAAAQRAPPGRRGAPLRRAVVFAFLLSARRVRRWAVGSQRLAKLVMRPGYERLLWRVGEWRAWLAFERAREQVPAYVAFVAEHGGEVTVRGLTPDFSRVPETTKENYVQRRSVEERCVGGRLPERGTVIDESSGTGGEPSNWVRGPEERRDGRKLLHLGIHRVLGERPFFVVNAFALGPWATGMNLSMAIVDIAVLKSTGPDVAKIEKTLRLFGPGYRYLICGYPPFLKQLVDSSSLDWSQYDCLAAVGGEGMSEALRTYLQRAFRQVYSSFGASDLEINIATENDFTIAFRRLLAERPELGEALGLPEHGSLPMVFQYNPLDYLIETNDAGELVITICRLDTTAPKLRYCIHDLGCVRRFPRVGEALAAQGVLPQELDPGWLDLPLLFHYGCSDSTVAFYGANVGIPDVQEVVFSIPELAERVNAFALVLGEDERANKTLELAFELCEGAEPPDDVRGQVLERLAAVNQDWREASRFMPESQPTLAFHAAGTGPFDGYDIRLKRQYVRTDT